jgi:hypothetical protein
MAVAAYECVPVKGLLRKVVTIDFTATALISQPWLEDRGVLRRQRGSQKTGAQVKPGLWLDE